MMKRNPIVLFFILFITFSATAQVPFFQQYFLLKKNEAVQVNDIFQDRSGFLWFGTNRGLFRYNGKRYQHFLQTDSLSDNNITAIAQDSAGTIWIGHRNGQVAFLENDIIRRFNAAEGSATEAISSIIFDERGVLWFSTLNDGLYYFINDRLYRVDEQEGMPDLFVYDLMADKEGNIWAGTDGGVAVCSLVDGKPQITVLNQEDGLADNIVKKLALSDDDRVYMATEDAGLVIYDPASGKFESVVNGGWTYGSVTDFLIRENKLWIATAQAGLIVSDPSDKAITQYALQPGYSLPPLTTLQLDHEGNVWAGSKAGVFRTAGDGLEFITSSSSGADNVSVIALAASNGDLWFSTDEGLFKRSTNDRGLVNIEKYLTGTPFQRYTIISLFIDTEGFVWAGLYGEGVLRINPVTGKIRHLNKELRNGNVLHITGKDNVVWLATLGGSEKVTYSGEKLEVKNYSRQNGLSSDFIYQVFIDSGDRIWFATDGRGVDMLDGEKFLHFEEGLPSKVVYGFAEDSLKQLWVNVQGNGIYKLENKKFLPPGGKTELRSSDINVLSTDEFGNLVIVHDHGIDIFYVKHKNIRYYGEESGLRDKQASLNAVTRDKKGQVFIGTDDGIVKYVTSEAYGRKKPKVTIDAVEVFDQKIDFLKEPSLAYNENSITISFLGFWFQDVSSLQFRYKMENFDEDWITTGDNEVTYSRLPPGDYTFRIRTSDNSDFSGSGEASIRFTINPPFWKTGAFAMACIAITVVSAYGFLKYRDRKMLEDKIMLEKKVEERTLEIQRKTEEIQAQNEEIMAQAEEIKGINENLEMLVHQRTNELEKKNRALEEYAWINAHKLRSPLASILGLINLISKTKLDDEARVINRHLQQSADELDDVIRSITKAIEKGEK